MDTKRLFTAMLAGVVLMLGWVYVVAYLDKKNPEWGLLKKQTAPTTLPAAVVPPATPAPLTFPATAATAPGLPGQVTSLVGQPIAPVAAGATQTVTLGSNATDDAQFAMAVTLTTKGAGVESVVLNRFKQAVEKSDRYIFQTPSTVAGQTEQSRVLASRSVSINGVAVDLTGVDWTLVSSDATTATFKTDVMLGGQATVLGLTKTFTLGKVTDATQGYELKVEYALANATAVPVAVVAKFNGTAAPPWEIERGPERQVIRGYVSDANQQLFIRHTMVEEFKPEHSVIDLTKDGTNPYTLSWFGGSGQYFNALVRADPVAGTTGSSANYLGRVDGVVLNPTVADGHLRDLITTVETTSLALAPGQQVALPLRVFFGPKQRALVEKPYYAAFPLNYDQSLVTTTWLCSFCTFPWLISFLVGMLNMFHAVVRDWGVAIILLVGVVRLLLHPVTRKAQVNMAKMQKMAPELERIKKKYEGDKEGLNKAMMGFYKEQGATPIMGCLPMLLQTPIWIALYAGLQSTFELRHQPFLYGLTWIKDLAKPDHLIYFPAFNLFGLIPVSGFNVIPFLLAVVFFLQFKLQPKPPIQTPEQVQQMKMMQWMTLLFPVFLYSAPAGLNIYILTSTTFGIIESKLIRDGIKRRDAAEAAGVVEVIDKPEKSEKTVVRRKGGQAAASATPPKKGIMGWLAEMQEKAEQIRQQQEKQQKKK